MRGNANDNGWPGPCIYTVYDRIFGDFPAKNTVYALYMYSSGQPNKCLRLARTTLCFYTVSIWFLAGKALSVHGRIHKYALAVVQFWLCHSSAK